MNADYAVAAGVSVLVIIGAVMFHYEALVLLGRLVALLKAMHRRRILVLVFGLLLVHCAEILLFGASGWALVNLADVGQLLGPAHEPPREPVGFLDYLYLAAVTYTTLGYGDLVPFGPVRSLFAGISLTGFVLITWSASFTFIEMQRLWKPAA